MHPSSLEFGEKYSLEFLIDGFGAKKVESLIKSGDIFKIGPGIYEKC
jgi:hypothetical protein